MANIREFLELHVDGLAYMLDNLLNNGYDPETVKQDVLENCPALLEMITAYAKQNKKAFAEIESKFPSDHVGIFTDNDQFDEDGNLMYPAAYAAQTNWDSNKTK